MSRGSRLDKSRSRTAMLWLTCDDLHTNAGTSKPIPEWHHARLSLVITEARIGASCRLFACWV
jgi:hypothetical protein